MSLIAFTGSKGTGKSFCSSILVDEYKYIRESFAYPLKQAISTIFNLSDECYNEKKKEVLLDEWNVTPRTLMQIIGTELFRKEIKKYIPELTMSRKSIWESSLYNKIHKERLRDPNILFTVDDVRFENEYQCIKDLGGIVIKIQRGEDGKKEDFHDSELGCSYDYLIENNGSLETMRKKLSELIDLNSQSN